jgi:hypothetical protein
MTRGDTPRRTVRIGAGAGFSGDRIEPAVDLAERGALDYLVFECLAERTIALALAARQQDPAQGFDPRLEARLKAVLPACHRNGTRIISNMGAANPVGAARAAVRIAAELGLAGVRVAAVTGDDILPLLRPESGPPDPRITLPQGFPAPETIVSANVYSGIEGIRQALAMGADIVLTGRVSDPALFVAPLAHEFAWRADDWHRLGQGTFVGHLLECSGQLTGGYFADPGVKDVPDLARLGFPFADVSQDGAAVLGKLPATGGRLTLRTCREQLLYEVLDPGSYLQPHVTADCRAVRFAEVGPDAIRMSGATGRARPGMLKVSVGYLDGYIGEGQLSYAGPGCLARARAALAIVRERLAIRGGHPRELREDIIGVNAVDTRTGGDSEPREVRIRVAARVDTEAEARMVGEEVEALYTNGPAGGGGCTRSWRSVIAVAPLMVPRSVLSESVVMEVADAAA